MLQIEFYLLNAFIDHKRQNGGVAKLSTLLAKSVKKKNRP